MAKIFYMVIFYMKKCRILHKKLATYVRKKLHGRFLHTSLLVSTCATTHPPPASLGKISPAHSGGCDRAPDCADCWTRERLGSQLEGDLAPANRRRSSQQQQKMRKSPAVVVSTHRAIPPRQTHQQCESDILTRWYLSWWLVGTSNGQSTGNTCA